MSEALQHLVQVLDAKRVGSCYMARCPAHDDRTPSLSIDLKNGKLLFHCHAGCPQDDVIAAVKEKGIRISEAAKQPDRRIVAEYDYTDERGNLLYQVVRFEPKDFRPRYPDGKGGWIWKKHPHQVLYRLREVIETAIVFLVEGERDVETLRSYGFVATTNAGGASAPWLDVYTEALRGREVIIIPDADVDGHRRGKRIARALLGHVARLIWWEPEGAKDITDWFERDHSEVELLECIAVEEKARQ